MYNANTLSIIYMLFYIFQTEKGDEGNSTQYLTVQVDMEPSSSSGIDIPEPPENKFQRFVWLLLLFSNKSWKIIEILF